MAVLGLMNVCLALAVESVSRYFAGDVSVWMASLPW
jgi:hypothetical protein